MRPTLLVAAAAAACLAAVYAFVGLQLARRRPEQPAHRLAMGMFSLWWGALSINVLVVSVLDLLGGLDALPLHVQVAGSLAQRLLLAASLVGLMHYLLFLLTGRSWLAPLVAVYGAHYAFSVYQLYRHEPVAVLLGPWRTDLAYATDPSLVVQVVALLLVVLAPVVASLAYFSLFFHVDDPTRRWRIGIVSWSLVVWWAMVVVAGQRQFLDDDAFQVVNRVVSLLAAFAILAAFRPPAWARRRWGVEPFGEGS